MSLPVVVVRATPGINCTASFCKLFLTTVAGIAVLSESFLSESNESVIFLETADTVAESFLTEAVPSESLTTEAFPPESFFNASCCVELFATGIFFCESGLTESLGIGTICLDAGVSFAFCRLPVSCEKTAG